MTNDFELFPDPADSDPAFDPDIALITAYLARELRPVQIAAVEERLTTDDAFLGKVRPIIRTWIAPGSFGLRHSQRASASAMVDDAGELSPAEIDAGWRRYLATSAATPIRAAVDTGRQGGAAEAEEFTPGRRISMTRIAAVIAVTVLPMLAFAQAVTYAANHIEARGHAVAQRIVSALAPDVERNPVAPRATVKGWEGPVGDVAPGSPLLDRGRLDAQPGQPTPAHLLGSVVARTPLSLGSVAQLRVLSDGRVLVSDPARRLVLLFDSLLVSSKVVLDSTMGQPNTFSSGIGGAASMATGRVGGGRAASPGLSGPNPNYLASFRADSSLWWDNTADVFVVIDPAGRLTRTMPPPPLASITDARPRKPPLVSERFGLVYQIKPLGTNGQRAPKRPGLGDTVLVVDDSVKVVRANFDTRVIDTLGALATGSVTQITYRGSTVGFDGTTVFEPFRFVDDVVTTSDGSIVTLYAREYRLEWITPDGGRVSQKLSYPWRRVSDDMRKYLLDSAGVLSRMQAESNAAARVTDSVRLGRFPISVSDATAPPPRAPAVPPRPERFARMILGAQFPDYYAPVPPNALRADADGNVWIKQVATGPESGFEVWEVVSRVRGVVDRVRIPNTRTVVGFGRGVVYLLAYDAGAVRLEKVRVK